MIKFSIGGRNIDPRNIADAMMKEALESIRAQIQESIGAIRDPETGEFPTVIIRGDDIDNLTLHVEGSSKLTALVKERLGIADEEITPEQTVTAETPQAFLSYTSPDSEVARKIAESLQANGIETWWDKWCIYPGDSLRQKIDEGLGNCTHFLVLLTPQSIGKPWVNQEMDAGLVRKLNAQCRFLPVRYELPASALPPLLSGMLSPEITSETDITQLISDIYGVTKKPPRGTPPSAISQTKESNTGYSPAASAVARLFVERSKNGVFADPQFTVERLAKEVNLSEEDTEDALHELTGLVKMSLRHVLVKGTLFAEFDRFWKPWNTADDALQLAADIVNDPDFPDKPKEIAERYGWEPRRLNPVVYYLLERRLLVDYQAMGTQPYSVVRIVGNRETRRFVKSRS